MKNPLKSRIVSFFLTALLAAGTFVLVACGGGGGGSVANADLAGYYTGSATVNTDTTSTTLDDLQILANGNRIMIMSASAAVLYDAAVTNINGSQYTADVIVYEHGLYTQSVTMQGSVNEGSSISGTFSGGEGLASGSFSNVLYASSNATTATLAQVAGDWTGDSNGNTNEADNFQLSLDANGMIPNNFYSLSTIDFDLFQYCRDDPDYPAVVLTPVANTSLYTVDLTLTSSCRNGSVEGVNTGLATVRADGTLVMMFVNTSIPIPEPCTSTEGCGSPPLPGSGIVELQRPPQ